MPRVSGRAHRVLFVDDHEDARDMYGTILERVGFEVETAHDGAEALRKVETFRPSVVVMDLMMPTLDGVEATRRLKSAPETRHIRVVALTAAVARDRQEAALAAGCDAVLVKPCAPIDLARVVDAMAASGRLSQTDEAGHTSSNPPPA